MASFKFNNTYLSKFYSISSKDENIKSTFKLDDLLFNSDTSELAFEKMEIKILNELKKSNPSLIIGSDLSNQLGITNKVLSNFNIPYLGVYNACSSFVEELIIGGNLVSKLKRVGVIVGSHNLNSERTYRYPIEYGSLVRFPQTYTATAAFGAIISKEVSNIKLESATIGKVLDYGICDANNMGAIMAPGACDTLMCHLKEMKRDIDYYDLIITGDLGKIGSNLFKDLLKENNIKLKSYIDAGSNLILDKNLTCQGASGPVCLPLVFFNKILKQNKYSKVLLIGTGALHNTYIVNQKRSIPCISHAISLEVTY